MAGRGGPAVWLATGLGVGFIRWAPGTFGSLWGLPVAWGVQQIPHIGGQVAVIVLLCALGVPLCTAAVRRLGGAKDPGCVVFDEVASMPMTFLLVPLTSWEVAVAGFLLNRLFDITKPPPARRLERLQEGLGVMADDWIAGLYSNLVLHAVLWLGWI